MKAVLNREFLLNKYIRPSEIETIKELTIVHEKFIRIEENAFEGLVSLEKLSFLRCDVDEIATNSLNGLSNLIELTFTVFDKLPRLDSKLLKDLSKLERIKLFVSRLEEIEENAFVNLKNLKELDLSNNKITRIKLKTFNGLINLK